MCHINKTEFAGKYGSDMLKESTMKKETETNIIKADDRDSGMNKMVKLTNEHDMASR